MLVDTIEYLERRATQSFTSEIIVVDDGSPDNTSGVVKGINAKMNPKNVDVKLIKFPRNLGKGAAITEVITVSNIF